MFRAFFRPSSGAQWLQWQPLVLPLYRGDSRPVFVVGPAGPTTNTALLSPNSDGKPEAATAIIELLMMGMRMPETCWAVFKRQVLNLRTWCIWLVDSFESMMIHGHANPKFASWITSSKCWIILLTTQLPNFYSLFCFGTIVTSRSVCPCNDKSWLG
jgi:hypothetical protein